WDLLSRSRELIHAALERVGGRERLLVGKRQHLHQDDTGNSPLPVNPEVRIVDAAPTEAAGRAHAWHRAAPDQKAKSPAIGAFIDDREVAALLRDGGLECEHRERADLVLRHQADGVRPDEALAIELAVAGDHAREAHVVARR